MTSNQYSKLTPEQKQLLALLDSINKSGTNDKPKYKTQRSTFIPTPFSVKQIGTIFNNITNSKFSVICYLALRYGLRRGEIVSLNVEDIDWELKRIILRKGKTGLPHIFDMDKFDLKIIDKYTSLLKYEKGALFPSNINRCDRIFPESISNEFLKILRKSGLLISNDRKVAHRKRYIHSFHNLRTTFISILCNTLDDIYVVQQLARHSNIKTTLRYYAFCGSPKLKDAMRQAFFPKDYAKQRRTISDGFDVTDEDGMDYKELDPLKILNLQLATGKISTQDYQQRINLIQSNNDILSKKKKMLDENDRKQYIG